MPEPSKTSTTFSRSASPRSSQALLRAGPPPWLTLLHGRAASRATVLCFLLSFISCASSDPHKHEHPRVSLASSGWPRSRTLGQGAAAPQGSTARVCSAPGVSSEELANLQRFPLAFASPEAHAEVEPVASPNSTAQAKSARSRRERSGMAASKVGGGRRVVGGERWAAGGGWWVPCGGCRSRCCWWLYKFDTWRWVRALAAPRPGFASFG
jgi:hypothetical protein